jgi:DNA polymerase III alpha subunit
MDFSLEGENIRFGLLSIKGISDRSIEKLNNFKNNYSTKFEVFEAAKESGLGIGALCALIQAGAFTGYRQSRSKIVYEAQLWNILTAKEKRIAMDYAKDKDHDLVKIIKTLQEKTDEKGRPLIKESRMATIRKRTTEKGYKEIYELNSRSEDFANWYYEKSLLGYTYGITLKDIFSEKRQELTYVNEIEEMPMDSRIIFIGRVEGKPYNGVSRTAKKSQYLRLEVADETGKLKVMIFNQRKDQCKDMNNGFPEDKNIVIVKGVKKEGTIFADLIAVQNNKIYTKLSDLKNGK